MLLADFIHQGTRSLEALYPEAEARSLILMLCESILGTKSYTHIVEPQTEIPQAKLPGLQKDMERLLSGEPIQYLTGKAEFCGRWFNVGPGVLIPRPETEILCREAVKYGDRMQRMRTAYGKNAAPVRILDLCTGSGCIAWTMALDVEKAEVVGIDLSEKALSYAVNQPFDGNIRFERADVLDTSAIPEEAPFDIILGNPPYVMESEKKDMRSNVLDYEPSEALFVPDSDPLLFYRAIAEWSIRLMAPDGVGIAEINEALGADTQEVFSAAGFHHTEIIRDIFDRNRFVLYKK